MNAPMVRELLAKWRANANSALRRSGTWTGDDVADRVDDMADELEAALSAPAESQPQGGEVDEHRMMMDDLRLCGTAFSKNGKRIPPEDVYITQPPAPAVVDGTPFKAELLRQQSEAWQAVVAVLNDVSPDWCGGEGSGVDLACAAIRNLATPAVQIAAPDHIADAGKMIAAPGGVERAWLDFRAWPENAGKTTPEAGERLMFVAGYAAALTQQANKEP